MAIKFSTFGPFELPREAGIVNTASLKSLWEHAKPVSKSLSSAIGVYIVARRDSKGKLTPWYVGKTDKGFKQRFVQHVVGGKSFVCLSKIPAAGHLQIFFIAR